MEEKFRRNNKNIEVKGVGEGAYRSLISNGGLNALVGNTKVYVSPMIGDSVEEDIENAKKIVELIQQ